MEERELKRIKRSSAEQSRRGLPSYLLGTAAPSVQVVAGMEKLRDDPGDVALKDATFAERRRLLVHCKLPIERFFEKFPWMSNCDEVSFLRYWAGLSCLRL